MTEKELAQILEKHTKWSKREEGGERADLRGADLGHADLDHTNLEYADLRGANLRDANLGGASLTGADLRHADLGYADLRYADLKDANLRYAYLVDSDLRYADLSGTDISNANFQDAYFSDADIVKCSLITRDGQTESDDRTEKGETDMGEENIIFLRVEIGKSEILKQMAKIQKLTEELEVEGRRLTAMLQAVGQDDSGKLTVES